MVILDICRKVFVILVVVAEGPLEEDKNKPYDTHGQRQRDPLLLKERSHLLWLDIEGEEHGDAEKQIVVQAELHCEVRVDVFSH